MNSYQFDFDLGLSGRSSSSSSSRPLRDQKPNPATAPSWTPRPAKPSWTHNPAGPAAAAPMAGDISGKSWSSSTPAPSSFGIPDKNPNLFGDLLGSALGQSRSNTSTAPLKASAPRNSYSMGSLSDSLTKSNPIKPSWGSVENFTNFNQPTNSIGNSMKPNSSPPPTSRKNDPFGSLVDFSKPPTNPPPPPPSGNPDYSFGSFQKSNIPSNAADYSFGEFENAKSTTRKPEPAKAAADPLEMLFSSPAPSGGATFSEMNDWDVEFGGNESGGGATTELEGLPPPPSGVTASTAKNKGMDNYKQGQFADAIKWLSWAVVLLEKSGDSASAVEILSSRASCYKEVGEYKKAVADCSKVLEDDCKNVSVLLQRALLYESTEKYRLGADDLRMVLKIDPGNRLAKSTIHRLNKLAD